LKRAAWILASIAALAGCGSNETPRLDAGVDPAPAGTEIVLAVGDEARVDGLLAVSFSGVPQDTRCPATVACPWAGDGEVEIAHSLGEGPSYSATLHTSMEPRGVAFGAYRITLVDLMPYPHMPGPIPLDEYAVRLRVERRSH
jgi:hypothetical protein